MSSISSKNERKQVELRYHSSKVEFVLLFFGRILGLKKSLRLCLTFSQSLRQLSFYENKILVQNCLLNEWILDSNKFCLKLPDLTAGMAPFLFSPTDGAASEITEENVASVFSMILIIRLPLCSVPSNKSLTLLVVE